jgi:hypothetical protein
MVKAKVIKERTRTKVPEPSSRLVTTPASTGSEREFREGRDNPERVAGDPTSYAFDPATKTFTFTYKPASGETRIVAPARVYPAGYAVDCGGCSYAIQGDELVIDKPGASTITLTAP